MTAEDLARHRGREVDGGGRLNTSTIVGDEGVAIYRDVDGCVIEKDSSKLHSPPKSRLLSNDSSTLQSYARSGAILRPGYRGGNYE
jgi:hypothetical protein